MMTSNLGYKEGSVKELKPPKALFMNSFTHT